MTIRHANCACGRLSLTVSAEPGRISMCHCHDCQKRTGSVFATQAWFPEDAVVVVGTYKVYSRTADSGNTIHFHFCPDCGSTLFYRAEAFPGKTAVPVGAFADASFPKPRVSVYEARKHNWVQVPEDAEHYD